MFVLPIHPTRSVRMCKCVQVCVRMWMSGCVCMSVYVYVLVHVHMYMFVCVKCCSYNIGVLHYHGRGVREDRRQAMEYFVKAANLVCVRRCMHASNNLRTMFHAAAALAIPCWSQCTVRQALCCSCRPGCLLQNESKAAETLGAFLGREKGAPWKRLPEESSLYEDLARKSKEYGPMK